MKMEDMMKAINTMINYHEERERLLLITIKTKSGDKYKVCTDSIDYFPGFVGLAMDDTYIALDYNSIESITA